MTEEPRAYTSEEATELFLGHIRSMVEYWDQLPDTAQTQKDRLSGLAFSILVLLDGDTIVVPGTTVTLQPHESDKTYHQANGENWFEPGTELSYPLHEMFYRKETA
jgi:hypothetical protein